ncbi:hypothetical protein SK128_009151 [Halocaridina rubra]|uniref:Death ligand signal enhancer n=1 Tax=Halocaridina rubra TaxID=373956 RepID=A0AAN8WIA4_HALRR
MWRVFNAITRGARNCRPNPCCSQEPSDDQNCPSSISDHQSSPLSCFDVPQCSACSASSEHTNNKYIIRFYCISCCLCSRILTWSGYNDKIHDHGTLVQVCARCCDACRRAQVQWKGTENRGHSQFSWSQLYREQLPISILGLGSVTAAAWSLCRERRNLGYLNGQKADLQLNGRENSVPKYDSASNHAADNMRRKNDPGDNENFSNYSCNFLPQYSPIYQNGNTFNQPDLFSLEIKKLFASQFTSDADRLFEERKKEAKGRLCDEQFIGREINTFTFGDTKPQIEIDKDKIKCQSEETKYDSGFLENVQESSSCSQNSLDRSSVSSRGSGNILNVTQEGQPLPSALESYLRTDGSLLTCEFKLPKYNTFQCENFAKPKSNEEVLIEDCTDSFQSYIPSSDEGSVSAAKFSCGTPKASVASIDEFSDGLKEILEVGRKDLNDFNTQFMGVLEGNIGRSISKEEPNLAIAYFRAGALLGDASSTYNLALCYHLARGIDQDLKMARELYEAASLAGHGWATYNLAVLLFEGEGGPADSEKAQELLKKAAEKGVQEAHDAMRQIQNAPKIEDSRKLKDVTGRTHQEERRQRISIAHSEPMLSNVLSYTWATSYSENDIDFMEDAPTVTVADLTNTEMEATQKPKFYLE